MKQSYIYLFIAAAAIIAISSVPVMSSVNSLDPTLVRDLFLIERCLEDPTDRNLKLMTGFGLPADTDPELKVFLHFTEPPSGKLRDELRSRVSKLYDYTWLPPVGAHRTGIMLALVKASMIRGLLKNGLVVRVTAAYRQLEPLNNNVAQETGAAAAWEFDPPVTGEGVRLAILDSGFRLEHEDLPEPEITMDYADYPDTSGDVTDHISGHGTHVAGTAFGSGHLSEGRWKGMAYGAEPIYLKIGNDTTSSASNDAVVYAIRGAATWCEANILTMSYGGYDNFNDGSSDEEHAVDFAVGEGVSVFMSAGNQASARIHYMEEVAAGDTSDQFAVHVRRYSEDAFWGFVISWYDGADTSIHAELTARVFDADHQLAGFDELDQVCSPRGTEAREYLCGDVLLEERTYFYIEVVNRSDWAQLFHIRSYGVDGYARMHTPDSSYTVLVPSTADSCISVAAYISRNEWTDQYGVRHYIEHDTLGKITYFSSIGPRIDGLLKPDITAPGQLTISCRDQDNIPLDDYRDSLIVSNSGEGGEPADYLGLMGTSMSSPAAAGTAALIFHEMGDPSPCRLREMICRGARTDEFTGETPNPTWGWGKIDVLGALSVDFGSSRISALPGELALEAVYPNPFNSAFTVKYYAPRIGLVQFVLYDVTGRLVWSTKASVSRSGTYYLAVPNFAQEAVSGIYLLRIRDVSYEMTRSLTLIK